MPPRRDLLHLFVLSAFAVAQPLFDLLGRYPTFFVAHGARPRDLIAFALALSVGLPAVLGVLEAIVGLLSATARRILHHALVAILVALALLPPLHRAVALPAPAALGLALAAAALVTLAYARHALLRSFVSALAPAVAIFPSLFLFHSPVAPLVRPAPSNLSGPPAVARPAPVVMVVFDELSLLSLMDRDGTIDAVRYPSFAALAATATWYRNATTVADQTPLAVPAILTGSRPDHNRLPTADEHPHSLFTLLGGAYELRVQEAVTALCPSDLCGRPAQHPAAPSPLLALVADAGVILAHAAAPLGWRADLPDIQRQWTGLFKRWNQRPTLRASVANRAALVRAFIDDVRPMPRPTLWFLHVLLPHYPYKYLATGTRYDPPRPLFGSATPFARALGPNDRGLPDALDVEHFAADNREAARLYHLRYLHQLGFVDRLLGELLDRLRQAGLFDEALLVITADHGICLRPGCSPRHVNAENLEEIMAVPLFVKAPRQRRGQIDDGNVDTTDILPTIAALLGVELPWPVDGQSLTRADRAARGEKVVYSPRGRSNLLDLKRLVAPADRPERSVGRAHQLALFGAGTPLGGQAPTAALATLIGRPVASLPAASALPIAVTLHDPHRYDDVPPPDVGVLPIFVHGQVDDAGATGQPLAIAVNGVVRAVTEVLADGTPAPVFGALIPESAWHPGANRVEVYAVVDDGTALRLAAPANAAGRER